VCVCVCGWVFVECVCVECVCVECVLSVLSVLSVFMLIRLQ